MPAARSLSLLLALAPLACGSSGTSNADGANGDPSGNDAGSLDSGHPSTTKDAGVNHASPPPTKDAGKPTDSGTSGADTSVPQGPHPCKRGVASNSVPPSALAGTPSARGAVWWYDWGNEPAQGNAAGFEFVPMIWGKDALSGPIPNPSSFVLGFNEPNFSAQSNMTPQEAAQNWPSVEALAKAQGIPIVSPGVNFCGSSQNPSGCTDPSITDPYTFLRDFFAACPGCEVDAIAVHWYNCDLPSLQAYIEGNATLQGFVQFGKPIWLTEFCCDGSHSAAEQDTYMRAAIPYLEGNPHVYRYSWFNASPIPSALLTNADGSLTSLGQTYASLPQTCE